MEITDAKRIIFYKEDKTIYLKYNNSIEKVDSNVIYSLRERLLLPYRLEFIGLSRSQVSHIISDFYDYGVSISGEKIDDQQNNGLHYVISFSEQRHVIRAIPVSNQFCSKYGQSHNVNPYIVIDLNGKRLLLEVPREYVKQNEGNYYYLAEDISENEIALHNGYVKIEYDYLYRIQDRTRHLNTSDILKR